MRFKHSFTKSCVGVDQEEVKDSSLLGMCEASSNIWTFRGRKSPKEKKKIQAVWFVDDSVVQVYVVYLGIFVEVMPPLIVQLGEAIFR